MPVVAGLCVGSASVECSTANLRCNVEEAATLVAERLLALL